MSRTLTLLREYGSQAMRGTDWGMVLFILSMPFLLLSPGAVGYAFFYLTEQQPLNGIGVYLTGVLMMFLFGIPIWLIHQWYTSD